MRSGQGIVVIADEDGTLGEIGVKSYVRSGCTTRMNIDYRGGGCYGHLVGRLGSFVWASCTLQCWHWHFLYRRVGLD